MRGNGMTGQSCLPVLQSEMCVGDRSEKKGGGRGGGGHTPAREVTVDGASELGAGCVPLVRRLEGDVGGGVVDDGEGAHPEVVAQPRHEPEFDEAKPAGVVDKGGQDGRYEQSAGSNADLHLSQTSDCEPLDSAHPSLPSEYPS